MMKLNVCNLLLEPEEFLTTMKESALGLAAAEDWQGERISNAGSEIGVRRKVVSRYISSQHLAEWIQGLFRGDKQNKEKNQKLILKSFKSLLSIARSIPTHMRMFTS